MGYQVSETTRNALIQAAGELFAHRDVDVVSVREITARAGVKVNAISYHFGGKDGLVDAVADYALRHWNNRRFEACRKRLEPEFGTRAGQRKMIIELLQIHFSQMCPEKLPAWNNMFLMRLLSDNGRGRERIARILRGKPLEMFVELYRKITGDNDPLAAQCWFLNVIGAVAVYGGNLLLNQPFQPDAPGAAPFYRRLRYWGIRNALHGLGLYDPAVDSSPDAFDFDPTELDPDAAPDPAEHRDSPPPNNPQGV